ncbi:hypothetical protein MRX96_056294 [Rhipicephalus microplus]
MHAQKSVRGLSGQNHAAMYYRPKKKAVHGLSGRNSCRVTMRSFYTSHHALVARIRRVTCNFALTLPPGLLTLDKFVVHPIGCCAADGRDKGNRAPPLVHRMALSRISGWTY